MLDHTEIDEDCGGTIMKKLFIALIVAGWVAAGAVGPSVNQAQAAVPLPSTVPLLGLGLVLLGVARRRS